MVGVVHAGLVPGGELLHAEAAVARVLRRQRVEGARPQRAHVGRGRRAQRVQERGQRAAAATLQ